MTGLPSTPDARVYLAVETGGTKIIAHLLGPDVDAVGRWTTTTPDQARRDILDFVSDTLADDQAVASIGMAAFGPIVLEGDRAGELLDTPKRHWTGANLVADIAGALDCSFDVDTDVNAAALAEHARAPGVASLAYLTVGTGIGGGLSLGDRTLRGAMHPEIGHLPLLRVAGDTLPSACPFHGHCAEGLAAGPAVARRIGDGATLGERPDTAALVAEYIAQLIASMTLAWSPERVVLGGGVGTAPDMLERVRTVLPTLFGDYGLGSAARRADFVVPPSIDHAGLEGAMIMARAAAQRAVLME